MSAGTEANGNEEKHVGKTAEHPTYPLAWTYQCRNILSQCGSGDAISTSFRVVEVKSRTGMVKNMSPHKQRWDSLRRINQCRVKKRK